MAPVVGDAPSAADRWRRAAHCSRPLVPDAQLPPYCHPYSEHVGTFVGTERSERRRITNGWALKSTRQHRMDAGHRTSKRCGVPASLSWQLRERFAAPPPLRGSVSLDSTASSLNSGTASSSRIGRFMHDYDNSVARSALARTLPFNATAERHDATDVASFDDGSLHAVRRPAANPASLAPAMLRQRIRCQTPKSRRRNEARPSIKRTEAMASMVRAGIGSNAPPGSRGR